MSDPMPFDPQGLPEPPVQFTYDASGKVDLVDVGIARGNMTYDPSDPADADVPLIVPRKN